LESPRLRFEISVDEDSSDRDLGVDEPYRACGLYHCQSKNNLEVFPHPVFNNILNY